MDVIQNVEVVWINQAKFAPLISSFIDSLLSNSVIVGFETKRKPDFPNIKMQGGFFSRHVAIVRNEKNIAAPYAEIPPALRDFPNLFLVCFKV